MLTLRTANILREYKAPNGNLLLLSDLARDEEKILGEKGVGIGKDDLKEKSGEVYSLFFNGEKINFLGKGGGRLLLLRGGKVVTLIVTTESEVVSLQGPVVNGDTFLFGKKEFFERVEENQIKEALISKDTNQIRGDDVVISEVWEENLKPKIDFGKYFLKLKETALKLIPERRVFVNQSPLVEEDSQSKKMTMSVGIVLIVILIASIGFGINAKNQKQIKLQYEGKLAEAVRNLEEARSLAAISPDKARELFIASEEILKEIEELKIKDSEVASLREKITQEREQILGEYKIASTIYLDLSLLSSGFKGDEISESGGTLYVLDKGGKKIVSVETETKKSKVVANSDALENPQKIAAYEERIFALEEDGVYETGGSREKVIEKEWEGDVLINAFAGNIYVLNKEKGEIYRYQGNGNTFGGKQDWLAQGSAPDFTGVKSWSMDGAIYVLNSNSKISKFSQGAPQAFSQSTITTIDDFYADEENEFVYAVDKAGKKIAVMDKKGGYKASYIDDKIGEASKIIVSEKEKKIIILTTDKLYSIEIKHL